MSLSSFVSLPGLTGWAYDPQRAAIYLTGKDGALRTWSLDQQKFTSTLHLGGSPSGVDVSADGKYLLVGNATALATGPSTYAAEIVRVNLANQGVERFSIGLTDGYERGVADLAVTSNGKAFFTTHFAGSGWTPFRQFQVDAATPSFQAVQGVSSVRHATQVEVSEDRRYILVQETDISSGPLHIYDSQTGAVIARTDLFSFSVGSGFNTGTGDINSAAGLVVDVLYSAIYALDFKLKLVADLSPFLKGDVGSVTGGEFNSGGHQLFLWQGPLKNVLVIDTISWKEVGAFQVETSTGTGYIGAPHGPMEVIAGGKVLAMQSIDGLELVDLAEKLKISIVGDGANQVLHGAIGTDRLLGEGGHDTIYGYEGQDFLRGGDGDDLLIGGKDFDDMHGNTGNDTLHGGQGDDWVVGGQGNDVLFGDLGNDIVFGNLGDDVCEGGGGADTLRGGQHNDVILGGDGDDWISGDLGSDTLSGGAGADTFNFFVGAGVDRVLDFSAAEGDRVRIEGGATYSVSQQGADTVISLGGGDEMTLVGVQSSSLPPGWILA